MGREAQLLGNLFVGPPLDNTDDNLLFALGKRLVGRLLHSRVVEFFDFLPDSLGRIVDGDDFIIPFQRRDIGQRILQRDTFQAVALLLYLLQRDGSGNKRIDYQHIGLAPRKCRRQLRHIGNLYHLDIERRETPQHREYAAAYDERRLGNRYFQQRLHRPRAPSSSSFLTAGTNSVFSI